MKYNFIILFSSFLFFFVVKFFIYSSAIICPSKILIDAEFDHDDYVGIYYSSNEKFLEKNNSFSSFYSKNTRQDQANNIGNKPTRRMKVRFGKHEGSVVLYKITIKSFFSQDIVLYPDDILAKFTTGGNHGVISKKHGGLLFQSGQDVLFLSKEDIEYRNLFLSFILPLVLSFCFYCVLFETNYSSLPAIADLKSKIPSMGSNIDALDGIRGLAALLVLASHTDLLNVGAGALGVQLFFALSGYLLAAPFVKEPSRAASWSYLRHYVLRRLKRILPMYYTVLIFTKFFNSGSPEAFRHFLFLQGDSIFWTIPQEMFFYLVLPFVALFLFILARGRTSFSIILLVIFIIFSEQFLTKEVMGFYGLASNMIEPRISIFLSGMLAAYIMKKIQSYEAYPQLKQNLNIQVFCSITGMVLLTGMLYITTFSRPPHFWLNVEAHYTFYGILWSVFILLVVLTNDAPLGRIMRLLPLRAVGIVGFSFYLLHPFLIPACRNITNIYFSIVSNSFLSFFLVSIMSYVVSVFTYSYIERPFLHYEKKFVNHGKEDIGKQSLPAC